jgi:hypothetical protein
MTMRRAAWAAALWLMHAAAAAQAGELRCHESAQFRVVERAVATGPGTDFLVRPLSPGVSDAPCRYNPGPGDFVIGHADAERFLALEGSLLVIDNGTGPDGRELIVWDLAERRKLLHERYGGLVAADATQIVFWRPTRTQPTERNCPQLAQWKAQLLGAAIEVQARLRLADRRLETLAITRCAPRQ